MTTARLVALALVFLGSLGVIVCGALVVISVFVGFRLQQVNTTLFAGIDEFMTVANEGVLDAQQVLARSKLTVERVKESLHEIAKREARQEIANRLDIDEKTAHVSEVFQQADQWIEGAVTASYDIQELLELGQTLGLSTDPARLAPVKSELLELRAKLAAAMEHISDVRRWTVPGDQPGEQPEIEPAVELLLQVVTTLSDIDSRLDSTNERLTTVRARLDQLGSNLQWWITAATVIVCLLIGWMGFGQWFVCAHGLKRYRQV